MLVLVPSFVIISPNVFFVWGSKARCPGAPSPTVRSAGHGCCSRGAWETRWKNSDSFVAAVLGLLFVGRNGPRVRASIVGSLEKAAVVDVLLLG